MSKLREPVLAMLREANIRDQELDVLAAKFESLCTGEKRLIGLEKFSSLLTSLGLPPEHCKHYFRAFDVSGSNGINLEEFLIGVAAMEPDTQHANRWNEQRSRLIFRLYDQDLDGFLDRKEFRLLLGHIRQELNNPEPSEQDIDEALKVFGPLPSHGGVPLDAFLQATANISFRGCSRLLRLPESLVRRFSDEPKIKVNGKEVPRRSVRSQVVQSNPHLVEWVVTVEGTILKDLELSLRPQHREKLMGECNGINIPVSIKMGQKETFRDQLTGHFKYSCRYPKLNTHPVDISSGLTICIGPLPPMQLQSSHFSQAPTDVPSTSVSSVAASSSGQEAMLYSASARNADGPSGSPGASAAPPSVPISRRGVTPSSAFGNSMPKWKLAEHVVEMSRTEGEVVKVESIWSEMDSVYAVTASAKMPATLLSGKQMGKNIVDSMDPRAQSRERKLLDCLRFFAKGLPNQGGYSQVPPYSWGQQTPRWWSEYASNIIQTCESARSLFLQEPRLLEIPAPCHVLGDLHGNFADLYSFEKLLWRAGPQVSPSKFVFLGDYVDRGTCGVEVTAYLLALKLLNADCIYLLRGNHEERETNANAAYKPNLYIECAEKFGDEMGKKVWEAINSCFDCLPLAAIVGSTIFCVHGGISELLTHPEGLAAIQSIPRDLPDPRRESPLAWDLMWSDPATSGNAPPSGFGPNEARSAGCIFSQKALNEFLLVNNFTHLIRAHEMRKAGFQVQLGAKLITVFSSSSYCGHDNKAACVLIHDGKIRFIVLSHD